MWSFKAGGAELIKVMLDEHRPSRPVIVGAAAIRAASPNSSEAGEPDPAKFLIFLLIAPPRVGRRGAPA
jgi:hypothetical protein